MLARSGAAAELAALAVAAAERTDVPLLEMVLALEQLDLSPSFCASGVLAHRCVHAQSLLSMASRHDQMWAALRRHPRHLSALAFVEHQYQLVGTCRAATHSMAQPHYLCGLFDEPREATPEAAAHLWAAEQLPIGPLNGRNECTLRPPLIFAMETYNEQLVRALLGRAPDIDLHNGGFSCTPLEFAERTPIRAWMERTGLHALMVALAEQYPRDYFERFAAHVMATAYLPDVLLGLVITWSVPLGNGQRKPSKCSERVRPDAAVGGKRHSSEALVRVDKSAKAPRC